MKDKRFIKSIEYLLPQPWGTNVQALPGGSFILNPTDVELRIIELYSAEIRKLKPGLVAFVQDEQ